MNEPRGKTSVTVTMHMTWKTRLQFFLAAFAPGPTITFVDHDVAKVTIHETKKPHRTDAAL